MSDTTINRRDLLRSAAVVGAASAAGLWSERAHGARRGRTAPAGAALSSDEVAAVDQALGKKGNLVAEQGVYTVPLPRNDLKVTIQGDPVPIPFGFGGWVAFKKTRD